MCRSDEFRKLRDKYQRVASASYDSQYKKAEAALEAKLAEGKLKEEEYRAEIRALQDDYESQLDNLDAYVDRFARIDLSEVSERESEIIKLVEQGEIEQAIRLYDNLGIKESIAAVIAQRDAKLRAAAALESSAAADAAAADSLYAMAGRNIDLLMLAGGAANRERVGEIYRSIAATDTTNLDWLIEAGYFFVYYEARYDEAAKCFELALKSAQEKDGGVNYNAALALNNLGYIASVNNDDSLALSYYERSLAIRKELYGEKNTRYARAMANIAQVYLHMGEVDKALDYQLRSLEIEKAQSEPNAGHIGGTLINIGSSYDYMGDNDKAEDYYRQAVDILDDEEGEEAYLALAYNNLGFLYNKMGKYAEGLPYLAVALGLQEEYFGENHPDVAISLNNIGYSYHKQADYEHGLEYYRKALEIRRSVKSSSPEVAESLSNIGCIYEDMGEYDKALEYNNMALEMRKVVLGDNHTDTAVVYGSIGDVHRALQNYALAFENYSKALDIYLANDALDDSNAVSIARVCEECRQKLEQH